MQTATKPIFKLNKINIFVQDTEKLEGTCGICGYDIDEPCLICKYEASYFSDERCEKIKYDSSIGTNSDGTPKKIPIFHVHCAVDICKNYTIENASQLVE